MIKLLAKITGGIALILFWSSLFDLSFIPKERLNDDFLGLAIFIGMLLSTLSFFLFLEDAS